MKKVIMALLLLNYSIYAQEEFIPDYLEHHSNYTPVTPNASSFLIYGNTPVNHATGIPQINIPLYTIKEDGVSIPISISYHASGVKVNDLAGVVGLKWTLNAGGGIFRQINDNPDEEGWLVPSKRGIVTNEWINQYTGTTGQMQSDMANSDQYDDYEPDDFSFSFAGYSGNFIFDRDGNVMDNFKDDIYIKTLPLTNNHFNFFSKDSRGNTFFFDNNEAKESNIVHSASIMGSNLSNITRSSSVSGWMLDRIITKNNKQIDLTYSPYTFQYTLTGVAQSLIKAPGCETLEPCGCIGDSYSSTTSHITQSNTTVNYTPTNQLINTIETSNVRVIFNYEEDTSLSTWKKKLISIDILDKIKNKTKSFVFTYSKFEGDPRLRLDQVQEIGYDGINKPAHKFYYMPGNLPNKDSRARDFAGYYNGETDNQTLVPFSIQAFTALNNSYRRRLAKRRENIQFLKIGTLNKIAYPTGGWTEFNYEPNAVLETTQNNPMYIEKGASVLPYNESFIAGGYKVFRVPFTLEKDIDDQLGTAVSYSGTSTICNFNPDQPSIDCSRFNIYQKQSDGSLEAIFTPFKVIGAEGSVNLFKGEYILELKVKADKLEANPNALISVDLNWFELENITDEMQTRYTGGLRVKEIIDKDFNDQVASTTKYTYDGLVGYGYEVETFQKSYGHLGSRQVFSSDNIWLNPELIKLGHFYKKVTIEQLGLTEAIKTIEEYKETFKKKMYAPVMIRQTYYKGEDKVQSTLFEYQNIIDTHVKYDVLADKDYCYNQTSASPQTLGYGGVLGNNYYHRRNVLSQKTKVNYFTTPNEPFKALIVQYTYKYNDDMQLISEEKDDRLYAQNEQAIVDKNFNTHLKGRHTKIEYTYPIDHQSQNITIATMLNKHQVGLPISKKVYSNGEVILGQYMDYDMNGNVIAAYNYNKGEDANNSDAGHIPSNYELYQEFKLEAGKPVEIKRNDGTPTAILWDTTHTFILAKIVGTTKVELEQVVSPIDLKITTENQLKTIYNNLRVALPNAFISTYTYDPLVGVTSMTDPNGYTTYYEYDDQDRLDHITDADAKVLKKYNYNYKGQLSANYTAVSANLVAPTLVLTNSTANANINIFGGSGNFHYAWTLNGQAIAATTKNITHDFTSVGEYTLDCIVTDLVTGQELSLGQNIRVFTPLTTPILTASATHTTSDIGTQLTAQISGGSGDLEYKWYIDGAINVNYTTSQISQKFRTLGTYTIKVEVHDKQIPNYFKEASITIYNHAPLATPRFTVNPSSSSNGAERHYMVGSTVTLTGINLTGGSGSKRYEWYIDNIKQPNTGIILTKKNTVKGHHSFMFKVIDNNIPNHVKTGYITLYFHNPISSIGRIQANNGYTITDGQSIPITITSASGGSGSYKYQWFVDNTTHSSQTSTSRTFSFSPDRSAYYTIYCRVIDAKSGFTTGFTSKRIRVTVSQPDGGGGDTRDGDGRDRDDRSRDQQ